jgi:hypothetical protein
MFKFTVATACVIAINWVGIQVIRITLVWLGAFDLAKPLPWTVTIAFGAPAFAVVVVLAFNVVVAILGRILSHYMRMQIGELSAIAYRYVFVWCSLASVALCGPLLVCSTGHRVHTGFWILSSLSAVTSIAVRKPPRMRSDLLRHGFTALVNVVPYVFFLSYLLFVSYVVSTYIYGVGCSENYWSGTEGTFKVGTFALLSGLTGLVVLLSARFGVNSPSMHMFYQSRIAEAYLREVLPGGETSLASRRDTTGANSGLAQEMLGLENLTPERTAGYNGPYLLLNAAMNVTSSDEPAWQDRRAANFLFSPLYCGYQPARRAIKAKKLLGNDGTSQELDQGRKWKPEKLSKYGYKRTADYRYGNEVGIRLAQAMSISGSAIGSTMGYHSSPRIRFLHTVLNLRLGWWFANPRYHGSWEGCTLRSRIGLLVSELAGRTNDHGPVIHLSDGGHFENLGLYELVRRRCRLILISDASEDHLGQGRDLGNAIERCRTDFGVEIYLDIRPLQMPQGEYAKANIVHGEVIYGKGRIGKLIYIRPTLTGSEPVDILSYSNLHSRFPHESTANQWFKESQFESYRRLGLHVGLEITAFLEEKGGPDGLIADGQAEKADES